MLVQGKSLKDKVGTPEEAEKKSKTKKAKDGLKQTKLTFKKKSPDSKGAFTLFQKYVEIFEHLKYQSTLDHYIIVGSAK